MAEIDEVNMCSEGVCMDTVHSSLSAEISQIWEMVFSGFFTNAGMPGMLRMQTHEEQHIHLLY